MGKTITVNCEECKRSFERSVFNPYMKTCPLCRGAKTKIIARPVELGGVAGKSALAAKLLAMSDKGLCGNYANTDMYTYKQKNGKPYFRVGARKFFSRESFVETFKL